MAFLSVLLPTIPNIAITLAGRAITIERAKGKKQRTDIKKINGEINYLFNFVWIPQKTAIE